MATATVVERRALTSEREGSTVRGLLPARESLRDLRLAFVLIVAFAVMLVLPVSSALAVCAGLCAAASLGEARAGLPGPVAVLIPGAFGGTFAASLGFPRAAAFLEPAASVIVLTVLLVQSGLRAAGATPGGARRDEQSDVLSRLARVSGAIWVAVYAAGLAVVGLSAAGSLWLGLELALVSIGLVAVAVLKLVGFGPSSRRQREFEFNSFTFRQVEGSGRETVLAFYAAEIADAIAGANPQAGAELSKDRILEIARRVDGEPGSGRHFYFTVSRDGRVIGVMAIVVDEAGSRLPVEAGVGTSVDPLRRFGRIAEGRRAAIDKEFRFHPDVLLGLLKCVLDVTLEYDVSFLLTHAFFFVATMYTKTGYERVRLTKPTPLFAQPAYLMVMNLAALVASGGGTAAPTRAVARLLNPYLVQRWINRTAFREVWRSAPRRAAALTAARVAEMLDPRGSPG